MMYILIPLSAVLTLVFLYVLVTVSMQLAEIKFAKEYRTPKPEFDLFWAFRTIQ